MHGLALGHLRQDDVAHEEERRRGDAEGRDAGEDLVVRLREARQPACGLMVSRRPTSNGSFFLTLRRRAGESRASARKHRYHCRTPRPHGPVSSAGEGFFINRLVLATGAAGGGATKADESARHVRTLIETRAIIAATIHALRRPQIAMTVLELPSNQVDAPSRCVWREPGTRPSASSKRASRYGTAATPRRRSQQETLHKSAYPRSSKGMWSIRLFAPSGTSSSSPSNSGVNTS